MHRSSLARCAVVATLVLTAGARADDAPDVVELRWSWPDGTQHVIDSRTVGSVTGQPSFTATSRSVSRLSRTADGWRIRVSPAPEPGAQAGQGDTYAISKEGRFAGLDRPARKAEVRVAAGVPELSLEKGAELIEAIEASRTNAFRDAWDLEEGFWNGKRLEVGRWYETVEDAAAVPDFENVRIPHALTYRIEARVPCGSEPPPGECVRLVLRATPQPQGREALAANMRVLRLGAGLSPMLLPDEVVLGATREREIVMTAEPATLVPHRTEKTTRLRATVPAGGSEARYEVAVRELATFTSEIP